MVINATFNHISAISLQDEVPMQRQNIKISKNNTTKVRQKERYKYNLKMYSLIKSTADLFINH